MNSAENAIVTFEMPSWFGSGMVIVHTSRSPVQVVPSHAPSIWPQTTVPGLSDAADCTPPPQGSFWRRLHASASATDSVGQVIAHEPQ